jgi:general secretion pathway protein G
MSIGQKRRGLARAFTMLEIMAVIVIIGMMAGAAALAIPKLITKAKIGTAKSQISTYCTALEAFRMDVGRYPTEDEGGLVALVAAPPTATNWAGPYLDPPRVQADPWNIPYIYHTRVNDQGETEYLIVSFGPSQQQGVGNIGSKDMDPVDWLAGGSGFPSQ